jgi:hypothetical protein
VTSPFFPFSCQCPAWIDKLFIEAYLSSFFNFQVDYLVEKGADPHIPDDNGQSAYNLAPSRFKNDEVAVESVAESEEMFSSQDIESVTESEEPIPTQNTEAPQESVIENDMPQETGVTERPTDAENVTQVKRDAENVTMVKIDLVEEVLTIEESQPMEKKIDNEVEQQNLELENVNTSSDIVMSEKQLEVRTVTNDVDLLRYSDGRNTGPVFEWSICVRKSHGSVFEWLNHLKPDTNLLSVQVSNFTTKPNCFIRIHFF